MPIQPLAPTLRAKAAALSLRPPCGLNVPASISCLRKARTSLRSSTHSGGKSTGSNWKLVLIDTSRSRGQEGPQLVGAGAGDHVADADGPIGFVAEFLAPRPQPARRMVERVLVGEAHRAVHLVGDRGAGAGGLADAELGDRAFGDGPLGGDAVGGDGLGGGVGGGPRGGDLAGELRQIVLHRLKLGDRPAELNAVERELHRG